MQYRAIGEVVGSDVQFAAIVQYAAAKRNDRVCIRGG